MFREIAEVATRRRTVCGFLTLAASAGLVFLGQLNHASGGSGPLSTLLILGGGLLGYDAIKEIGDDQAAGVKEYADRVTAARMADAGRGR